MFIRVLTTGVLGIIIVMAGKQESLSEKQIANIRLLYLEGSAIKP